MDPNDSGSMGASHFMGPDLLHGSDQHGTVSMSAVIMLLAVLRARSRQVFPNNATLISPITR